MAVLFSTLGFTAKLALAPLRERPDVKIVHLFYGAPDKPESREALKAARATTETLGVQLVEHRVKNPFDYEAILEAFAKASAQVQGDIIVNASGGTRVMIMASTIFAFTNDLPLLYYDEYETTAGKEIPLRAFRRLRGLGESQLSILQRLGSGKADMGTLARDLGLAPSTLSAHVHRLVEGGIVTVAREGKRRMVSVVPEVRKMGIEAVP